MTEDFEQRYDANATEPLQVWIFCRLCRCRVQVRTVPRPNMPFRCFCGNAGAFTSFDVFRLEEDVVRFAKTFEELYQETKTLLREAEMPMPRTQVYKPGQLKKILAGEEEDPTEQLVSSTEQTADELSEEGT